MTDIYDYPLYYEIAFSFRDIGQEVDVFEECVRKFSRIKVKTVLELGCGNCPHATTLCDRGYRYVGIDINPKMIDFVKGKADMLLDHMELIRANMNSFDLDHSVDFVFIQVGSLFVTNEEDIRTHFDSVARALSSGGLYFLDGCITFDEELLKPEGVTWELERDGIKVRTNVVWESLNRAKQLFTEIHRFDVDERGKVLKIEGRCVRRAIYPQEFLQLVKEHPSFEFVGWWHLWDLKQPLDAVASPDRAIALLRRL